MKNARPIVFFKLAFGQPTRHLYTDAQHGFGHLNVLPLKKSLGIFRKIQRDQRPFVFSTAQLDAAVTPCLSQFVGRHAELLALGSRIGCIHVKSATC